MRKLTTFLAKNLYLTVLFTSYSVLFSQNFSVTAKWELTNPSSGGTGLTVSTSGPVEASNEYLHNMEINQYGGPNFSQRVRIAGNAWPALQTTRLDNVYIQFEIYPQSSTILYLDSVALGIAAASISSMKADICYSKDTSFSSPVFIDYSTGQPNNYLRIDSLTNIKVKIDQAVNDGEKLYLRIYPWVDNDPNIRTGKYVCLQNVIISGNIESLGEYASLLWIYHNEPSEAKTGPVIIFSDTLSSALGYSGVTDSSLSVAGKSWYYPSGSLGSFSPVSDEWKNSVSKIDSLYIQYAFKAKSGGTFIADRISMYMGGWHSSDFHTSIIFSQDVTFSSPVQIENDTSLKQDTLTFIEIPFSANVSSNDTLYFRIYPWTSSDLGPGHFLVIDSFQVTGKVTGITADPPTVTTGTINNISTTYAACGGDISSDGGGMVIERGICWNTLGNPDIYNDRTIDGTGSGSYSSVATGLSPGTDYYLRAYATNFAGTSYGNEISFRTLDSISLPELTTSSISNILAISAVSGGNITDWGGDTIKSRGLCWNTSGSPTLSENYTELGDDFGSFTGILYPLDELTGYYVRAYATNSRGTGYGNEIFFTTQAKAPDSIVVVAKDGSGNFTTVQAAFNSVPDNYTGRFFIKVKPGIYYEKLILEKNKVNVVLMGEHPDSTILTYDDYAGIAGGTSSCQSVAIEPDDFTAINITFQNTVVNDGSVNDQQAVALRVNGDRQSYYHCKILGYQDTYYVWGGRGVGRIYMKECYIEGSVDFIFGRDIVVFDSCEIHFNRNGGCMTAASTDAGSKYGLVFLNCTITSDITGFNGVPITNVYLGRPWQNSPRTVFIKCNEPSFINPAGWLTWNVQPALYAEYQCFGAGSGTSGRITSISRQLTDIEASEYTPENIFSKRSNPSFSYDWLPEDTVKKFKQIILFNSPIEKIYGDTLFDPGAKSSSNLTVDYESSDLSTATINDGKVQIGGVGSVTITATQPGNYLYEAASAVDGILNISKAELVLVAEDKTRKENEENPDFNISYTGFVYDDDENDITPPQIQCEATLTSPVGDYPITLSGGSSENYILILVAGTLTISPFSSLEENRRDQTLLFPNPAKGSLFILNNTLKSVKVRIIDIYGKEILLIQTDEELEEIDISEFPLGIYIVKIEDKLYRLFIQN